MKEIDLPPLAPSLIDSMRSMGYSLGSALADLIDNSISAQASNLEIEFRAAEEPFVGVIDDGIGMTGKWLEDAMRHGSRSPLDPLSDNDLGRFGLGMKTASLSQCRRMTVVSLTGDSLSAYCWDLDVIRDTKRWTVLQLSERELRALPFVDRVLARGNGTLVLWEKLDRLLAGEIDPQAGLDQKLVEAREHLALVFHRYLDAERGLRRIGIRVNGLPVVAVDPFLSHHPLTQKLEDDDFRIEGKRIRVKPFILPHPARLSPEDARLAGGSDGLRAQQGFYVYRQKRLIIWGNWFRLARKDEMSRLARVRVDIPNSLDHLWTLDIRKSVANPPEPVRRQLRRTVEKIRERSRVTHLNRGHAERRGPVERGWLRVQAGGSIRYDINREHVAIVSLKEGLDKESIRRLESALRVIETCFPVESIYVDVASEQRVQRTADARDALKSIATDLLAGLAQNSLARAALLNNLHAIEPFSAHPQIAREISKELSNE